jgi:AcrR family transcriptional regulator
MSNSNDLDTRERILKTAQKLFAEKGFNGTSVRDIAQEAQVNVAALNYHFQTKQSLHQEIFRNGFISLNTKAEELAQKENLTFVDLAEEVTHLFLKNHSAIRNFFLLSVSPEGWDSPEDYIVLELGGPPGSKTLFQQLKKETEGKVSEELLLWAVRTLLSNIIYLTLLSFAPAAKKLSIHKHLTPNKCQAHIRQLAEFLQKGLSSREKL